MNPATEAIFRLAAFAGIFLLMVVLEALFPRRQLDYDRLIRWPGNLLITMLNTFAARLIVPLGAVGFALAMENRSIGLFNALQLTEPVVFFASLVLLDFAIWLQHLVFHRVPMLWRIHRMHHTDNDIDVTTGARFHPFEIVLSMLIKVSLIGALGIPAIAVLWFEVILNTSAMFNHANVKLPLVVDGLLRKLIVTPDMHRVHHSSNDKETNSNFGFCLSIWDKVFGTYTAQPEAGHKGMTIGLADTQDINSQRIDKMLAEPFRKGPADS